MQTRANAENVVYFRQGSVTRQTEICCSKTTGKIIIKKELKSKTKNQMIGSTKEQAGVVIKNKSEGRINKGTRQTCKTKNKGVS